MQSRQASKIIRKPLTASFRNIKKNADALIRHDPILALVEIITNANDSYKRLEKSGRETSGIIHVKVTRARPKSVVRIFDEGEGINGERMDEVVSMIGEETSGFSQGVRGFFGEGLKYAIVGMGHGEIHSIQNGKYYNCVIRANGEYERDITNEREATQIIREQKMDGLRGNCTQVLLYLSRPETKTLPRFENLKWALEHYFSLRELMADSRRQIRLTEVDRRGHIKQSEVLNYRFPEGQSLINNKEVEISGFPGVRALLTIFYAAQPLSTKREAGPYRDAGLLIKSLGSIHDITFFKFDHDDYGEYTSRLFGSVECDYIGELLRQGDEGVISDRRDGLNHNHPFVKALATSIEPELRLLIDKEKEKQLRESRTLESSKIKRLFRKALPALNRIASNELRDIEDGGDDDGTTPPIPINGFDFIPSDHYMVVDREYGLRLAALYPQKVKEGAEITLSFYGADGERFGLFPPIQIDEPTVMVKKTDVNGGIWLHRFKIKTRKLGDLIIEAQCGQLSTTAILHVIEGTGKGKKHHKKGGGLFREIKYSPEADPHVRVRYVDGVIIIATEAPSVKYYFGRNGEGQGELHCRVLTAELVLEAVLREIARRKAEAGKLVILDPTNPEPAIQTEYDKLKHLYGAKIHQIFVRPNEI